MRKRRICKDMEETTFLCSEAKRVYSRVGLGLAVMFLVEIVLSIGLGMIFDLDQVKGPSIRWALFGQIIPVYGSIVAGYLVFRRLPSEPPEPHALQPGQFLRLPPITSFMQYAASGIGNLLLLLAGLLLKSLLGAAPEEPENPVVSMMQSIPPVIDFLLMVVVGPIAEELFCRKAIIDRTRIYGERLSVISTAVIFGIFHHSVTQFLYTVSLGLIFAYVYIRTGKLRYPIALHIYNNLLGFLAGKLVLSEGILDAFGETGKLFGGRHTLVTGFFLLLAALFIAGLIFFVRSIKNVHFEPAERELPKKYRFRCAWCSAAMLAYVLLGLFLTFTG